MRALAASALAGAVLAAAWAVLTPASATVAGATTISARNGEIAFVRNTDFYLRGRLLVVNPDGSGVRRVLKSWRVADAAWSPNGKRIALTDDCELKVVTSLGRLVKRVTKRKGAPCDVAPSWSPDGMRLAFVRAGQGLYGLCCTPGGAIHVVNANGTGLRRLTRPNETSLFHGPPSWSPDGRTLIFSQSDSSLPDPLNGNWANSSRLYVINLDGTGFTALPQNHAGRPRWSPDGTRIAFKRTVFHKPPPGATMTQSIILMSADGSAEQPVVQYDTRDRLCEGWFGLDFVWSADGTQLAVSGGCPPGIHVMDLDGTDVVRVTSRSGDRVFSWRPLP